MSWVSPRTWVTGETVTAAMLNQLRDALNALGDPWTSWTPTWTATSTNPVLGNGTVTAAYMQTGKLVHWRLELTIGSTTTFGTGQWRWTFPANPKVAFGMPVGTAFLDDSSAGTTTAVATTRSSTTWGLSVMETGQVSSSLPWTWATGDVIRVSGTYETI